MVAPGKPVLQARQPVDLEAYAEQQIRDAIVSGTFQAGDRLIETASSGQLGVSRHPMREALRRLSKEGIVTVRANRGAVVADINVMALLRDRV